MKTNARARPATILPTLRRMERIMDLLPAEANAHCSNGTADVGDSLCYASQNTATPVRCNPNRQFGIYRGGWSRMWPMGMRYIWRPRFSWEESMHTVRPSRLVRA